MASSSTARRSGCLAQCASMAAAGTMSAFDSRVAVRWYGPGMRACTSCRFGSTSTSSARPIHQSTDSVFSASRNNNLQLKIYEETEAFLANWTSAEAALTVTSGLLAGQLAVNFLKNTQNLKGLNPVFIYAPSAHPAVWEAPPPYL